MKRSLLTTAILVFAAAAAGAAAQQPPAVVHGEGCVERGVEMRCLIVKDIKSGKTYNLIAKEPRPMVGAGIVFTAVPHEGVTDCMQGIPIVVTRWTRKDSLHCSPQEPVRK